MATFPSRNYAPGTRQFELPAIPVASVGVRFEFTREAWPVAPPTVLTVNVEWSQDNGQTWRALNGAAFGGGDSIGPSGGIAPTSGLEARWPEEWDGISVKARKGSDVRVTFVNPVPLRTAVTVESI